ncbi:MAG: MFS transporter, partial [Rhodospirillales bacterium]|nr:MFS transporter [Rhodospirillales bacterium]
MARQQHIAGDTLPVAAALAWTGWSLGAAFYCYGFFQRVVPSVIFSDLMADFAVSGAVLGNLSAFYFYAYAGVQIPTGLLIDRLGPRRVLAVATALCGAGSLLFALAGGINGAYAGRALIGAGAGVAWIGTLQVAGLLFPQNRFALLSGLTLLAGVIGAVAGQAPLAVLVEVAGWRWVMAMAAGFAAVLALAIWFLIQDRRTLPERTSGGTASGVLTGLKRIAGKRQSWICGIYGAGLGVPTLAFAGLWGVPYMMQAYGLDRPAAAICTTFMLLGWAVGAPVSGWISDRLGCRRPIMIWSSLVGLVTLAAALYIPELPLPAVVALLLIHGAFSGGMVLSFVAARENNHPSVGATAVAFVNMAVMGSSAL